MNTTTVEELEVLDEAASAVHQAPAIRAETALQATPTPADLLRMAVSSGADLDRLERLMSLQERWESNEARKAYNAAFADFKAEAVRIIKNREVTDGPLKGKAYAELHSVVDAVTPALSRHGLSASWRLTKDAKDWMEVTCTLSHVGGHSESVSMGGPPDAGGAKNLIQQRGSTKTYLERYTLKAILGIAEGGDDTDGNAPAPTVPEELLTAAREASLGGWNALSKYIKGLTPEQRKALEPESTALKNAAKAVDARGGK